MPLSCPSPLHAAVSVREEPARPLSRFVLLDGHTVHCLDTAPRRTDLPAVLFVHGWCGSAGNFRGMIRRMPRTVRCIAFDFPGHGRSDKPDIEYSSSSMAGMVERLHGALGLDPVDLVGHSLGGQLAVQVAHRSPALVRRLVLIDPIGLAGQSLSLYDGARGDPGGAAGQPARRRGDSRRHPGHQRRDRP